jgi:hypothetical protein
MKSPPPARAQPPLSDDETGLLEDCYEDWRGLWELTWGDPGKPVEQCIAFLKPLVAGGYLTILHLADWNAAPTAEPMSTTEALAIISDPMNYAPPDEAGAMFYALSITKKGEAAIPPGAFPDLQSS